MPLANHRMRSPAWVIGPALGTLVCAGLLLGAGKTVLKGAYIRQLHFNPNVYSLYSTRICLHAISSIPSERVCMSNDFLKLLPEVLVETGSLQSASGLSSFRAIADAYAFFVLLSAIAQGLATVLIVPLRIQHMQKKRPAVLRILFAVMFLNAFLATNVQMVLGCILSVYKIKIQNATERPVSSAFIILNVLALVLCYIQTYPALLYAVERQPSFDIPTTAKNDCNTSIFVSPTRLSSATTVVYEADIEKSKQVFVSTNSISSYSNTSSIESPPPARHLTPSITMESAPTLTSSSTLPSTI